MANRTIQQKILKMKRRNRHAVFSGETTKYAVRVEQGIFDENGHSVTVPVGKISLSKAVINTGRGPDPERMQEYYQRIHSFDQSLPQTLGLTEPMKEVVSKYNKILQETPKDMRICLTNSSLGRLDLYFNINQFFFVDYDAKTKTIRRSRIYPSKQQALLVLRLKKITWVESLP